MKTLLLALLASGLLLPTLAQEPAPPAETKVAPKRKALTYTPPKNQGGSARLDGDGGSRGPALKLPSIYVLSPDHKALTTREQPSLFWFQTGPATTRFELTLVDPKQNKPVLKVGSEKAGAAGIHRVQLAKHDIKLAPGVPYKWSVALVPDPKNRSQDVIASGVIERVGAEKELTAELEKAGDPGDKAAAYAAHGIWYDALEALTDQIDSSKDKSVRAQRAALLEQVGLKDAAKFEKR